ncbi:Pre-mRNA-splicing factor Cwf15/Cwc15 [Dimargaris cristalligena]|uniref:Pre-mRNA-splicing factor Cwf15/Cwc15 n=1 Tax=Dimargaris cristalligena TaxID=215637 RepID=A0A4P9ZYM3_9FUNG|nr:Pre-mRNA-splicing factor Cwf15/Cwc15 [Dimargaris cristalligena]|eukprot:RKP37860.1 Pre-mRNA-splicing factor Cwf15/Cwc15 [Dimargaris cristalligena]
MTTAARPTFDPARGRESKGPKLQTSARDLPSHTTLKYRQPESETSLEQKVDDLKQQLLEAEREHFRKLKAGSGAAAIGSSEPTPGQVDSESATPQLDDEKRRQLLEQVQGWDVDDINSTSFSSDENEDDSDDDGDDDDDDETAQLLRELEKIKRERAEEEAKKAEQQALMEESQRTEQLLGGNPLLNLNNGPSFAVKRRWDDDVIFKNQARDVDDKPQKRFINDMLRSDFHRKFMDKYIR